MVINWWCAGGRGGVAYGMGRCVFSQWGRWRKTSVQTFSNFFLKTFTEGAVTTEAWGLFQYFTALIENAARVLWRWLALWSTLYGASSRR